MQYLLISVFTFIAWLFHVAIVAIYLPHFADSKTIAFRLLHATEIFVVMFITFLLYNRLVESKVPVILSIATSLFTLAVIDTVLFISTSSLRSKFDWLHVLVAFTLVAIAITVASRMAS